MRRFYKDSAGSNIDPFGNSSPDSIPTSDQALEIISSWLKKQVVFEDIGNSLRMNFSGGYSFRYQWNEMCCPLSKCPDWLEVEAVVRWVQLKMKILSLEPKKAETQLTEVKRFAECA